MPKHACFSADVFSCSPKEAKHGEQGKTKQKQGVEERRIYFYLDLIKPKEIK